VPFQSRFMELPQCWPRASRNKIKGMRRELAASPFPVRCVSTNTRF
jgi:hypothetical protein